MRHFFSIVLALVTFLAGTRVAGAVPPPDLIFAATSQLALVIAALATIFSGLFAGAAALLRRHIPERLRSARVLRMLAGVFVVAAAIPTAQWVIRAYGPPPATQSGREIEAAEIARWVGDVEEVVGHPLPPPIATTAFFAAHQDLPISIPTTEYLARKSESDFLLLDAREDEEVEAGRVPDIPHIRFADLVAGAWTTLPRDKVLVVLCYSGLRGRAVATFLRSRGLAAQALGEGLERYVSLGAPFEGTIDFLSYYRGVQYTRGYRHDELEDLMRDGVVLVDARARDRAATTPLEGSVRIPAVTTPTENIPTILEKVHADARIIVACDDLASCFDAEIVGIRLERSGRVYLGRYLPPGASIGGL